MRGWVLLDRTDLLQGNPAAILDIGAHHGYMVDKLLDYAPGAKVHASEPTPQSAAILRQRMSKRPNVHVHEMALGNKTGMTCFHLSASTGEVRWMLTV